MWGVAYEHAETASALTVTAIEAGTTCTQGTCTTRIAPSGAVEHWEVPAGVSRATVVVSRAGGGAGATELFPGNGGVGGKVRASVPVEAGTALALVIGEAGVGPAVQNVETAGGYGGGGNGGPGNFTQGGGGTGGSGGGGSFVFAPDGALLLAAGGGGGAGNFADGGAGGQAGGQGGTNGVAGGLGATVGGSGAGSAGGQAGSGPTLTSAVEGVGGSGAGNAGAETRGGGGGGGGYYGGGGGGTGVGEWSGSGGGGGGADFGAGSATNVIYEDGLGGLGGEGGPDAAVSGEIEIVYALPAEEPAGEEPAVEAAPHDPSQHESPVSKETPRQESLPAQTPSTTPVAQAPASARLTLLTHRAQGVINSHALTIAAGCGAVGCTLKATGVLHVPGLGRMPKLRSAATPVSAASMGHASLAVPKALRWRLRHYLLHHRAAKAQITIIVTGTFDGGSSETTTETLPIWVLPGLR
ncbi:MAG TPA: hypothetical protein VH081_09355 [Solirubrobacteraceae bacterium]|jgi:hypothetical protein|nr:hypothetical protein [Solirubrobacteraceae bacterium]